MATVIAMVSFISAAASISGFVFQIFERSRPTNWFVSAIFASALLFSGYVLLVPGTAPVDRVAAKIRYFSKNQDKDTLVQEGTFSFGGRGPYEIQFPEPFRDSPSVYIINMHGFADVEVPAVGKITNHHFAVMRWGSTPSELVPTSFQEYKWVAEGAPFH